MKQNNFLVWSVLVAVGSTSAIACDCCSVFSACNLNPEIQKGFFVGVAEQFTHFGTLQLDGHKVADDGQYIDSFITQVAVGYNFNERWSAQVNLPFISRSFGSATAHDTVSGFGDLSVIGNFRAYQFTRDNFTFNWTILGGVKLATGDATQLNVPEDDFPEGIGGHDIALGSGSVDGIVGTGFSARWKRVFLNAQMQYAIRTEGHYSHRYANDWTWSGGPGAYLWLGEQGTLSLQAVTSGEAKGFDTYAGVADEDSAITAVYLGPQLNFTWGGSLGAQVGVDVPVSLANAGLQVVPDYRIRAAVTWKF
jgi:hypothetical protein